MWKPSMSLSEGWIVHEQGKKLLASSSYEVESGTKEIAEMEQC